MINILNFKRNLLFPVRSNSLIKSISSTKINFNNKLNYNIKYLGESLGSIIKENDESVYNNIEKLRTLSKEWRLLSKESIENKSEALDNKSKKSFDMMVKEVNDYDIKMINGVARGFTHFLSLSNSAENQHRTRRLRERLLTSNQALPNRIDSCNGTIEKLLKKGITSDEIINVLKSQSVEIVLTAHPTEVNRKTMLEKHQRIKKYLDDADHLDINEYEKRQINQKIKAEISAIWESDELMRKKPTPVDEAKSGLGIVENILWKSVPSYLRKLDDVIKQNLHQSLPLNFSPIKIASWMGGDRDGNPNVTPAITKEVLILSRLTAAKLLKKDISVLHSQLSLKSGSKELIFKVGNNVKEPYRAVLHSLDKALDDTIMWCECDINNLPTKVIPLLKTSEVIDPLLLLYQSLIDTGNIEIADGDLIDTIRRLYAFGLTLLPLDIRQESTRHSEALDAITNYLGIGSYLSWDENKRREWLLKELSSKRPLLPRKCDLIELGFSTTVIDTLTTFDLIAASGPGSLGAYVISQCQQSSDILAVMLLQQDSGVISPIRVVPLFETLDDLERSSNTIEALFSMNLYRERIGKSQEIMVGYSDSSKDAGRLASSWALYNCQQQIVNIGKKYDIDLTFFHGKGGTVGRGGNPQVYQAILAHPPYTVNSRFRVTEQGEMITQNLGQEDLAERTLDLYTAGVLAEFFEERIEPKQEWKDVMDRLSIISCDAYRGVVKGEKRFVSYFRSATPELELSGLNVGSRPAKRNPTGGVESLRAIPWVFAWTQSRLNLPTWLGVGEALNQEYKKNPKILKEMYINWPWFQTLIDLLEMILVKSEERIAENYDKQLVYDVDSLALGNELRDKLKMTCQAVLNVSGHEILQSNNPVLLKSLAVRNPYVDPLNIIQAELLKRLRDKDSKYSHDDRNLMQETLLITINGIANGMRNSG